MNKLVNLVGFSGPGCGGLVVTTPQQIALKRAGRYIKFLEKLKIPVLGVIENMVAEVMHVKLKSANVGDLIVADI